MAIFVLESENPVQQEGHSFNSNGGTSAGVAGNQSSGQNKTVGENNPSDAQQTHQCSGRPRQHNGDVSAAVSLPLEIQFC